MPLIAAPIINTDQLEQRTRELALQIARAIAHLNPVILTVLEGAQTFSRALRAHFLFECTHDEIKLKSYEGTSSTGNISVIQSPALDLQSRHILIIEDIVDTGRTLSWLKNYLHTQNVASIQTATLLLKRIKRTHEVYVDYSGFEIEDRFVVGFGMDWNGQYRELPDIREFYFLGENT